MILWHPKEEFLSRMVDGELPERQELDLRHHLASCWSCRKKSEAFFAVKETLRGLPAIEERFLKPEEVPQLTAPSEAILTPIGVKRPLLLGGLVGGFLLFLVAMMAVLLPQPTLKVVSSGENVVSINGKPESSLRPGSSLRTLPPGHVDLEVSDQLLLRLKPGTTVTWQQVNRSLFGRRVHVVVNLMRGELVARTEEGFWGSHLEVRSPTASALVKGTAFSMKVEPAEDATSLKVLTGSVFFSPYLSHVGVEVKAGQTSQIRSGFIPKLPKELSQEERKPLLEAYQIGGSPVAAMMIGGGPERAEELLQPALLYMGRHLHPDLQLFLRRKLEEMNQAILKRDLTQAEGTLKIVEMTLEDMKDHRVAVPVRLFVGAYAAGLNYPEKAIRHFHWVVEENPQDPLASLALAAIGLVTERQLRDSRSAQEIYREVLRRYSKSPEADYLRSHLGTKS